MRKSIAEEIAKELQVPLEELIERGTIAFLERSLISTSSVTSPD